MIRYSGNIVVPIPPGRLSAGGIILLLPRHSLRGNNLDRYLAKQTIYYFFNLKYFTVNVIQGGVRYK